jgi:hypothetical protein
MRRAWKGSPMGQVVNSGPKTTKVLISLFIAAPAAFSSGTGMPLFGSAVPWARSADRQVVRMTTAGGLLVGAPSFGVVAAIEAYAPGCKETQVILRQQVLRSGILLQFAMPSCLKDHLTRATVFLKSRPAGVRFVDSRARWVERPLQDPAMSSTSISKRKSVAGAVDVDNLESIQLLEHDGLRDAPPAQFWLPWITDVRTRVLRSAWHALWPAIGLAFFSLLSWSAHKAASLSERP